MPPEEALKAKALDTRVRALLSGIFFLRLQNAVTAQLCGILVGGDLNFEMGGEAQMNGSRICTDACLHTEAPENALSSPRKRGSSAFNTAWGTAKALDSRFRGNDEFEGLRQEHYSGQQCACAGMTVVFYLRYWLKLAADRASYVRPTLSVFHFGQWQI